MTDLDFTRRKALAVIAGAGITSLAGCRTANAGGNGPDYGPPNFEDRAADRGFEYEYDDRGRNRNMKSLVSNAGVYASDVDNDGRTDLLALGGEQPVLFRNTGESFERAPVLPTVEGEIGSALFLDYDNDGWDELLLFRLRDTPVFLDNEGGEFSVRDVGFEEPLTNPVGASTADYDGDGYLDVFVVQNGDWGETRPRRMGSPGSSPDPDNGFPNVLYRGDGDSFERVADAGLDTTRWSLATAFVDLTGNGYPDIYVANDYNYDVLYVNRGDETFEPREVERSNRNAMSAAVADVTGDGNLDVFVTNIYFDPVVKDAINFLPARAEGNNLFVNDGAGHLSGKASEYGVRGGGWGWAATVSDFTNDGETSIFHTTTPLGAEYTIQEETGQSLDEIYEEYPYLVYPMFFDRQGEEFTPLHPPEIGLKKGDGRGVVALDTTNDGTLDLAVADMDNPYRLYENRSETGNWLEIDVEPAPETTAIGTEVTVSAATDQYQVLTANADFLSQEPRRLHFGVGSRESVAVTVAYPDGGTYEFSDVETNRRIVVTPDGTVETA
ncbi:MAG: CRTAC1 family protein [Halosimplex sp.]